MTRKSPAWLTSLGLHAALVLLVGLFWVVEADVEFSWPGFLVNAGRRPEAPVMERERSAEEHPPIKPEKVLQPDPEIVNDAEAVVVNTNPTNIDSGKVSGDSLNFVSDKAFRGRMTYDIGGLRSGAAGRYGAFAARFGWAKDKRWKSSGWGACDRVAVIAALQWLARHQNPDGSWSVRDYVRQCKATCAPHPGSEDFDTGATGLALLAFLGAGYTHLSKDTYDGACFGDVVRRGLRWMMGQQDAEGGLGPRVEKFVYNHAIGKKLLLPR